MKAKTIGLLLVLVAVAGTMMMTVACQGFGGVPGAEPMPEGSSFSGLWHSEQFDHMYLHQDGDQVKGVYMYGGGGSIEGEVDGNLLLFSWHEPGDRQRARQDMSGKGYLQLEGQGDDQRLVGEWGYNEDRRGAGPWEAEFIREREDDDPTSLEEVEQRR